MSRSPVTIIDVARHAGVSKTTASDALSGSGRVSRATRARIEAVAAELGYVPNSAARFLRGSKVGSVGLHIPRQVMGMTFYMEFAFAAVRQAQEYGIDVTLLTPRSDRAPRLRADGLIVIDPLPDDPVTANLLTARIPVVTVGGIPERVPDAAGVVRGDYAGGMRELLGHMRASGATRPALIAPNAAFRSEWATTTREAYEEWCGRNGTPPLVRGVATDASSAAVQQVVRELLTDEPGIDALVCAPDGIAMCAMTTMQAMGRRVGEDMLLAACVDNPALLLYDPPVTAIELNAEHYGVAAVDLLVGILSGTEQAPLVRTHPVQLLVRASTRGRNAVGGRADDGGGNDRAAEPDAPSSN
ncbi:LacI family DNA-binding transcriptional regulator [Streptomyces sp. NPDC051018]|uniref:LacI family DNA-binding transcriptional regulator n=1 Tax=Streptomyces sp. NPDC051018 TaxID=3365639 RepID=UPI0037BACBD5